MKVIGIQLNTVWEDKAASHAKVRALLDGANVPAGALVVLPEMFATGFSSNVTAIAEPAGCGDSQDFLARLAIKLRVCALGGVVIRGADGRGHNEAVAYDADGRQHARYHKLHPFAYGGETSHYDAGDRLVRFNWSSADIVPLICYDLRFPEVFRCAVRSGAQVFTVIANWPATRETHWLTLLRARAIENQAYVVGVNRCGRDPNYDYGGRSQIIDPQGTILADAGGTEGVIAADLDLQGLQEYRNAFPALADIRCEFLPPVHPNRPEQP